MSDAVKIKEEVPPGKTSVPETFPTIDSAPSIGVSTSSL
jgi:hypothetical protein